MFKKVVFVALVLVVSGCSYSRIETTSSVPNNSWQELRSEAELQIEDFQALNEVLNANEDTGCDGDCFVFVPEDVDGEFPKEFRGFAMYPYAFGAGGSASAIFKINENTTEQKYTIVLSTIQDTQLCSLVEEKEVPIEILPTCVAGNGEVVVR
jgi:hypothetical protein